jgi:hypothetical protein
VGDRNTLDVMAKAKVPVADENHEKSVGMMERAGILTTENVDVIAQTEVPGTAGYHKTGARISEDGSPGHCQISQAQCACIREYCQISHKQCARISEDRSPWHYRISQTQCASISEDRILWHYRISQTQCASISEERSPWHYRISQTQCARIS